MGHLLCNIQSMARARWSRRLALLTCAFSLTSLSVLFYSVHYSHHAMSGNWTGSGLAWGNAEPVACVSWRATDWCHPNGKRLPDRDRQCSEPVPDSAGYCECAGRLTVAHMGCGPHRFTCMDKCAEISFDNTLAKPLPAAVQCAARSDVQELAAQRDSQKQLIQAQTSRTNLLKQAILRRNQQQLGGWKQFQQHKKQQQQSQQELPTQKTRVSGLLSTLNARKHGLSKEGTMDTSSAAQVVRLVKPQPQDLVSEKLLPVNAEDASRVAQRQLQSADEEPSELAHSAHADSEQALREVPAETVAQLIKLITSSSDSFDTTNKGSNNTTDTPVFPHAPWSRPGAMQAWLEDLSRSEKRAKRLWDLIGVQVRRHGHADVSINLPGIRTDKQDWVTDGLHMPADMVGELRAYVRSFKSSIPAYPSQTFSGRGVVMIAGGLKYMVSAWVSLHMLRNSGCMLPVEMWFPISELPTPELEQLLHNMGVAVRSFDLRDLDQTGFTLKAAALVLSSFQEVLFLDADNFPVRDPATLFTTAEYNATGAIFWQDFWDASAAPEVFEILEIPQEYRPNVSHESGQILVDKARHWPGLMLSIYLNYYHELYYELLTNFMGKGDKETFIYSMLSFNEPVYTVKWPTQALGLERATCEVYSNDKMSCEGLFACNTMVQRSPAGDVMFLHSNLNKWTLDVPNDFYDYSRRWRVLAVGDGALEDFPAWSMQQLGFDVEQRAYELVRKFRCSPFFDEYYRMRIRRGDKTMQAFNGLHEVVEGMHLLDWYRFGLTGPYSRTFHLKVSDKLQHLWNGQVKTRWRALKRYFKASHQWTAKPGASSSNDQAQADQQQQQEQEKQGAKQDASQHLNQQQQEQKQGQGQKGRGSQSLATGAGKSG